VIGTTFRTYPSYPQRFIERLAVQPACDADMVGVDIEPLHAARAAARFTEDDLHIRQFTRETSRRLVRKGQFRAA
jgi:hypothetical protein